MAFQNERIAVLYGSQTGNAQDLAERIWRESKRFYFQSFVKPLDEYNVLDLSKEQCIVFICSTTGQGEEPDNMKKFWRFMLRKNLPGNALCHMKFAVLGLGDSSYVKFNFAAKRLNKRLLQLGSKSVVPLGLGDDQHDLGYDAVAGPWIDNLFSSLLEIYPLPEGVKPLPTNLPIESRWTVFKQENLLLNASNTVITQQSIYYSTRKSEEFTGSVISNDRLTEPSHFQDVRLIKFKTEGEDYSPGDVVVLRPKNLPWKIQEFKEVLTSNGIDIKDSTLFEISEKNPNIPVPQALLNKVTFGQLCEEYFDLFSVPRRSVFQVLVQITDSELEKEKCLEFCSAEGQQEMYTYINRQKRNIVEVLGDFPNATKNLTPDILFEILPPIKPREFSIASSCKVHKDEIHILLAVVKYKTKLVKERVGLCSNYLADLKTGDLISMWVKKGSLKFPKTVDTSVIMVGPGTGVAPFRSYIFEMSAQKFSGKLILFYGCRYKDKDFLCREDFEKLSKENKLVLIPAFSRDQERKIYVQDKIRENSDLVYNALISQPSIYIAGNSKNMPQEVRQAFIDVFNKHNPSADSKLGEKYIETLEKQGSYQTECWS